jgi:hypothetical protein
MTNSSLPPHSTLGTLAYAVEHPTAPGAVMLCGVPGLALFQPDQVGRPDVERELARGLIGAAVGARIRMGQQLDRRRRSIGGHDCGED